jgi:hypothetical protein
MTFTKTWAVKGLATCAVLAIVGCSGVNMPNYFPDGYTHHANPNQAYRSDGSFPSRKFTQKQRAVMTGDMANQMRMSVYTLAETLTLRAGLPPKPVYIAQRHPSDISPFDALLDNDLRESLRHLGYRLANTPDDAYAMRTRVEKIQGAVPDAPNVTITLEVYDSAGDEARLLTTESGNYFIKGADVLDMPFGSPLGALVDETAGQVPALNQ